MPETIVSFCVVAEKVLKIRLYKKPPVLINDNSKLKENNAFIAVLKRRNNNIKTINMRDRLARYKLMFTKDFSDDEV